MPPGAAASGGGRGFAAANPGHGRWVIQLVLADQRYAGCGTAVIQGLHGGFCHIHRRLLM